MCKDPNTGESLTCLRPEEKFCVWSEVRQRDWYEIRLEKQAEARSCRALEDTLKSDLFFTLRSMGNYKKVLRIKKKSLRSVENELKQGRYVSKEGIKEIVVNNL